MEDEEKLYNETIKVKVKGEEKIKHIDIDAWKQAFAIMKKIKSKNKCEDLFKNTVIGTEKDEGLRMYP